MEAFKNFLQSSATFDWLVMTLTVIMILAGVILLFVARRPRSFYFYLGVGLLPLLLGLLTTYLKIQEVERMMAMVAPNSGVEVAEAGRREAWIITYIGAVGTVVAVLISLLGMISKKGRKA
jgi:uncharacterized membrane protein